MKLLKREPLMIFDVESIGLYGEGFAWGALVIWPFTSDDGYNVGLHLKWCHPDHAMGDDISREWVKQHCLPQLWRKEPNVENPAELRSLFWEQWLKVRYANGLLVADCPWPVESNFLLQCVTDQPVARGSQAPYPLLDAASWRKAGLAEHAIDVHEPLSDAIATWNSFSKWWLSEMEEV